MDFTGNIGLAFVLTILAGLSTGIGGSIIFIMKKFRPTLLSFAIGFSAGVMIYVSFVELLPHAIETINPFLGVAAFFFGILTMSIVDFIVPEVENPHSYKGLPALTEGTTDKVLMRTGALTAVAIAVHNFPEGLATFSTALSDIITSGSSLRWPSLFTTYLRASRYPSPCIMPRKANKKPFCTHYSRE